MSESESRRILCVEDDQATARIIARFLQKAGFVVDSAYDGEQAMTKWRERTYDAVILDRTLPGRDGLDVYCDMLEHGPSTPTVMVTATGDEQVAVCAMKMGVGDYLIKDPAGAYLEALPIVVDRTIRQHGFAEEKQRNNQALQQSEARFRTLVSNIPGIVCRRRVDRDWTLEYASEEMERITGFAIHEFLDNASRSFVGIVHPDDVMRVQETISQAVALRKPYTVEYRIFNAAGRVCDVVEKGQAATGDVPNVAYVDSVLFDITERRRLETALRDPESVLRDLYDASSEAIFILRSTKISYANASALRMFNYALPTDAAGMSLTALSAPQPGGEEDAASMLRRHAETAYEKKSHAFPWLGRRRDGTAFPCEISLTLIGQRPDDAFQCVVRDLTERRRVEERMRLDEARMDALLKMSQMTEASEPEIVDYALNEAVRLTGGAVAVLCDIDAAGAFATVRALSKDAMPADAATDVSRRFAVQELGVLADPVRQRRAVIVNDYGAESREDRALPIGIAPNARLLAVPVFDENRVVAVVATADKPEPYDDSDACQLTLLMQSMRRHLRYKAIEEELRGYREDLEATVRRRTEEAADALQRLRESDAALHDRVRELQCLLELSRAAAGDAQLDLSEVMQCVVRIVPAAFGRSESARARIVMKGRMCETPGFVEGSRKIAAPIMSPGGYVGAIEVCRLDDEGGGEEPPFRPEEKRLLEAVAEHLGGIFGRCQFEAESARSQKAESMGRLAAGIAQEIHAPTQDIGDRAKFLEGAFSEMDRVLGRLTRLLGVVKTGEINPEAVREAEQTLDEVDVGYWLCEIPRAIRASLDDVRRVSEIVRATKEFAYPVGMQPQASDLNHALENILTVSRGEWKLAADAETHWADDLPPIVCLPAELNQALLELVVRAGGEVAEAVAEGKYARGTIRVSTRRDGDWAEIRVQDDGLGIRPEDRGRVFDPFAAAEDAGRGVDRSAAFAYRTVVGKHRGTIRFETEVGLGTTFIVRLPIEGAVCSEGPIHDGELVHGVAG